jgi:DNA-binding MarR family transcriptional regulator
VSSGILSGRNTSVSDIYLSLGVSKSTAIRCVTLLEAFGIFEKSRDPSDRRRAVIALSREFRKDFIEYLDAILSQLDEMTKQPTDPLA